MRSKFKFPMLLACLAAVLLLLVVAGCGDDDDDEPASNGGDSQSESADTGSLIEKNDANASTTLTIGSKNFTEEFILGEIYSQALEAGGYTVKKELNLGSEQIAFKAVKDGEVDAYPEYVGTALTNFYDVKTEDIPKDTQPAYDQLKTLFAKDGLTALPPTPFTDTNAVGMTQARADELGIKTISDLEGKAEELTLSGSPECRQRTDCKLGLERTYGLNFGKYLAVDLALRHEVLTTDRADVSIVFGTDGQIKEENLVVLDDDKKLFPPYNVTLVVNDKALEKAGPDFAKIAESVQGGLSTRIMQELNARVDLEKQQPEEVARAYLEAGGYIE